MIKPIKIDPLNMTNYAYFECENCGSKNEIFLTNKINTDDKSEIDYLNTMPCPDCDKILGTTDEHIKTPGSLGE